MNRKKLKAFLAKVYKTTRQDANLNCLIMQTLESAFVFVVLVIHIFFSFVEFGNSVVVLFKNALIYNGLKIDDT